MTNGDTSTIETAKAHHAAGRLDQAAEAYYQIIQSDPGDTDAAHNLSVILLAQGDLGGAGRLADQVLAVNPGFAPALNVRGAALLGLGRTEMAVASHQQAVKADPEMAEAHSSLSNALREAGEPEASAQAAREAVRLKPDFAEAHNNLGNALIDSGDVAGSTAAHGEAVRLDPDFARARYNHAMNHVFRDGDPMLAPLAAQALDEGTGEEARSWLLFAHAKALDDTGKHGEAFAQFTAANRIMGRRWSFDLTGHAQMLDAIKTGFPIPGAEPLGGGGHVPVFVTGLSRSGKSLVERLLSTGLEVASLGERANWQRAVASIPTEDGAPPLELVALDPERAGEVAEAYLSLVTAQAPDARLSLSTSPGNLPFVGMFLDAFASAKVIHCRREFRDMVLRIYFKRYAGGNGFAYDLAHIAEFIRQYEGLMDHWRRRHGDRIIEIDYADLVGDPAAAHARLRAHCGLSPAPAPEVDFSTAEIGHWRNYAEHLEGLDGNAR